MSCAELNPASMEEIKKAILKSKEPIVKKRTPPKTVPKHISIDEILNTLPMEVFEHDRAKAYGSLFISMTFLAGSMLLIANTPYYMWPVGWILAGCAITGLFSIAHDCMHNSFERTKIANDILGTLILLPLGYSFESWKINHRYHSHAKTIRTSGSDYVDQIWSYAKGSTFWLANIGHWLDQHLNVSYYEAEDRTRVQISNYLVYASAVALFSLMFSYVGLFGIAKYWVLPLLSYHVMMSTITLLPGIVLDEKDNKKFIVHVDYPKWFEFLTNDITLNLPRDVSSSIPHYRLRIAYKYLKKNWGDYILEAKFDASLVSELAAKTESKNFQIRQYNPFQHSDVTEHTLKTTDGHINPVASSQPDTGFQEWLKNAHAFLSNINYIHSVLLLGTPLIALYGLFTCPVVGKTVVWALIMYLFSGLGITAGYHRLWAHKAYCAKLPLRLFLLFFGTSAVEGSLRWWARDHRAHHRYTDTDKDPYSASHGFIYSHIGWMLVKQDWNKIGRASIDDLNADPWIMWQHKHYAPLALLSGIIFPTLVPGLFWGDWKGGYFFAAVLRLVWVHHSTFMVNSLAHFWGVAPFADEHTPRDSVITALCTFGEGYHNFHHEFPHDYRNAIKFYQWDPTKWFILINYYLGQAYDLRIFDSNAVLKGQVQMRQKILDEAKEQVHWGTPVGELPIVTKAAFDQLGKEGYKLLVINQYVHDVTDFEGEHPGGNKVLKPYIGKDGTSAFGGGVYYHSNAAKNLLDSLRVGRVAPNEDWTALSSVTPLDEFPDRRALKK